MLKPPARSGMAGTRRENRVMVKNCHRTAHAHMNRKPSFDSLLNQAEFLVSVPEYRLCPTDQGLEVAFAGRSNAGKSSAINALVRRRGLAKTSKTPGRTRHLVFFCLDEQRRLVDLPGYGFAKASARVHWQWERMIEAYLGQRKCLRGLVLLLDCRRSLLDSDRQILLWCLASAMPVHILLTKADKLTRNQLNQTQQSLHKELDAMGLVCTVQGFSALKNQGVEEARILLAQWFDYETKKTPA